MVSLTHSQIRNNRLLAALPVDELQRILPSLELVSLKIHDSLYDPDQIIEYVYFPLSGMASVLVGTGDGRLSEVGIVGNEGMVGVPVFLGAETTNTISFYQIAGEAVRMRRDAFLVEIKLNGTLVPLLQHYTMAYFAMVAQASGCNSQHRISQRCARWLLLTHDRIGKDQFGLTQEFISQMLGVRRAGVNAVMRTLQEGGAIDYHRGLITIVDRKKLEQAACECYEIITAEYHRRLNF